jgi:hypothetical protein
MADTANKENVEGGTLSTDPEVPEIPRQFDPQQIVKHEFVHMSLDSARLEFPMKVDVNTSLMVSINGGPWYGKAVYTEDEEGGKWTLLYHWKADMNNLKQVSFKQVQRTNTYLAVNKNPAYNCLLIEQGKRALNIKPYP